MALTSEDKMIMPVTPMYNGNGGGFGNMGNDWSWLILLLLIVGGGFGYGFGGGFGGGGVGSLAADGALLYPWMNQKETVENGFQNMATSNQITAVQNGVNSIQNQLCGGFSDVTAAVTNGFSQAEISNNARQIANMQQMFNTQTAVTGAISDLASQQANCCCENRLATCQTQNVIQNEGNATRFADANNTRDIIEAGNRNSQAILDKLCQLELDGVKGQLAAAERENLGLQNQLNMASFRESQANQNAFFAQGMNNEVDALYSRLKNCPVGTYTVCNPTTPVGGCSGCGGF